MQEALFKVVNPYDEKRRTYLMGCAANEEFIGEWMGRGWLFEPFNPFILGKLLPRTGVAFDIGAHVGTYSVVLGKALKQGRLFAFEPQTAIYQILLKNLARNRVRSCTAYNLGIAHQTLTTTMQAAVGDGRSAGVPVSYDTESKYNYAGMGIGQGSHFVACVQIDDFVSKTGPHTVDLLKVDVEGAEPFVFFGARQTIAKFRPILQFEENKKKVSAEMAGALGAELQHPAACFQIREFLAGQDYLYFRMPFDNILLVPRERMKPALTALFNSRPSDSSVFEEMYVFNRDPYSPGFLPE